MLTNVDIRKAVNQRRAEAWAKHRINADQALNLIALVAKMDIAECYDDAGKLIPVRDWPLDLRMCVREVRSDGSVQLLDALRARQVIAEAGGKFGRGRSVSNFDAEAYLVARTRPDGQPADQDRDLRR